MLNRLYLQSLLSAKILFVLATVYIAALIFVLLPINHDIGWLIHATAQWHNGAELYTEIIEVNPPLIFFLMTPIVWLSQSEWITPVTAAKGYLASLVLLTTLFHLKFAYRLLPRHLFYGIYIAFTCFCVFVVPANDFSQRDHLSILFLMPYLLSRFIDASLNPNATRSPIEISTLFFAGLLAGLGVCMKPYFVLFPIVCELWVLAKHRHLKSLIDCPQNWGMAIVALVFASYILFDPNYIQHMVPLGKATYWTYGIELSSFNLPVLLIVWTLALVLGLRIKDEQHKSLCLFFSLMSFVGLLVFLPQSHYRYQLIPFITLLLLNTMLAWYFFQAQSKLFSAITKATSVLLVIALCIFIMLPQNRSHASTLFNAIKTTQLPSLSEQGLTHLDEAVNVIDTHFKDQPVYVLSPNVLPSAIIANYTTGRWVSGFPALWPLPAIDMAERFPEQLSAKQLENIEKIKSSVLNRIRNEITDNRPAAIIVDITDPPSYFGPDFKFVDFFNRHAELADIFESYEPSDLSLTFIKARQYKVYTRRPEPHNSNG